MAYIPKKNNSRKNSDGTWKNQTSVTGNYFGSGIRNDSRNNNTQNKNNNTGIKKNNRPTLDRRERVGERTKGKSYYAGKGYQDRGETKSYTFKRNVYNSDLDRARKEMEMEERGSYLNRVADDSSYASSAQGKQQRERIDYYNTKNQNMSSRAATVSKYNDENDDQTNRRLQTDSSLNRYRGSLTVTARQAERNNDDWNKWQQSLNGIRSESPDDYALKVERGKKRNPLRRNGSTADEQTKEYIDFLYGAGYDDKAIEGVNIINRSEKTQNDYKTKAQEYQNAALRSNQNIANNYTAEAKKTQQKIDDIKSGKVKVADKQGEINALNDKRAEYEQQARTYQTYADRDQNVTKNQLKMNEDPDAEAKIEAGRRQDTFLYSKDNADAYRIAQSMGGLDDDESLKTASMTLSEDEKRQYYYTLNEDGEEAAKNYLRTLYTDTGDDTGGLSGRLATEFNKVRDTAGRNNAGVQTLNKVFDYAQTFGAGVTNATVGITDAARRMGGDESVRLEGLTQKIYQDNVEKGRVNKVVGDIAFNIGNMVPAIGVSIATGGMGAAPMVAAIASASTTGLSSFGNTYQQARREGFASDEATGYALLNGISEAALQYALTGVGAMAGGFTTDALAQTARGAIGRTVTNPVARYALQTIVGQSINSVGEFTEEYLQEVLDPVFRNWALGEANEFEPFSEDALYAGLLGALSAGVMNSVSVVGETAQYTRNGRQFSESIPDLITQGLSFAGTEDVSRTAAYLQNKIDNGGTVTDMEAGLLVQQTDDALAVENDIKSFLGGDADWDTISDKARATIVTPSNAEYLAREFGIDVNENMSPEEMKSVVYAMAEEVSANENRRSFKDFFNEQEDAEQTEQNRKLFEDSQKASGKQIIVADLGDDINGYATADKIVVNSNIANTEDGARFVLAHELTHGTEMSRHYNALRDSAREYFESQDMTWEDALNEQARKQPGLTQEALEAEVVADFVGNTLFTDFNQLKTFVESHRTQARRIMSWLKGKFVNTSGQEDSILRRAYNNFERAFNEIDRSVEGRRAALQYQQNLTNAPQYSTNAVEHFGTTDDWNETGYLMPDGTQLDFSGRHDGNTQSGVRTVDHRDIADVMDPSSYTDGADAMITFMDGGNIRISPESGGINLSVLPTDKQFRGLADFIRQNDGEVMLDVDDQNGRTVFSKDYAIGTNPSAVFKDIRGYFNDNTQPGDALYSQDQQTEEKVEYFDSKDLNYDARTQSLSARQFSADTLQKSDYVTKRDEMANQIADTLDGVTVEQAQKWIDDVVGIANVIFGDRGRLDYTEEYEGFTSFRPNSEYDHTIDFSLICAKRRLYTGTMNLIRSMLPNAVLLGDDIARIRELMVDKGDEVACGTCYVETSRLNQDKYIADFIREYQLSQRTGNPIEKENSKHERKVLKATKANDYRTFVADPMLNLSVEMFASTEKMNMIRRNHPELALAYDTYMNKLGTSKPKAVETRVAYRHEILDYFKTASRIAKFNGMGGLRINSFSDFETPHLIDMMQVVLDMAAVGLKSHAYTKVPNFAWVFGDTGVKINCSLFGKGTGVNSKGQLVFDDIEGMPHEEAFKLRDRYSKNVGTILVGMNEAHIRAALLDPRIDMVIPYHKSQMTDALAARFGLENYHDFTNSQNEVDLKTGTKVDHNINVIFGEATGELAEDEMVWDFNKPELENTQAYLDLCEKLGRKPKFAEFLDKQGDKYIATKGYYKMLVDFKIYDNDGAAAPHEVVTPNFNMDEANRVLEEYEGGADNLPADREVADRFVKEYLGRNTGQTTARQYSKSSDRTILDNAAEAYGT